MDANVLERAEELAKTIAGEEIIRKEIDKRTGELVAERRRYQSIEVGLEEMQDPQKARERDLECRAQAESEVMEKLRERIAPHVGGQFADGR